MYNSVNSYRLHLAAGAQQKELLFQVLSKYASLAL